MNHPTLAKEFIKNKERARWHDQTLWWVQQKRDRQVASIPEWEQLREAASDIKTHLLSRLDDYLIEFEERATANGITVHWAVDADQHNAIVLSLLQKHDVKKVVKSKSMLTEECHLNAF